MISDVAKACNGRIMNKIVYRPKTTYLPSSIFVLEPPSSTELSRRAPSHSAAVALHGMQFTTSPDLPFFETALEEPGEITAIREI